MIKILLIRLFTFILLAETPAVSIAPLIRARLGSVFGGRTTGDGIGPLENDTSWGDIAGNVGVLGDVEGLRLEREGELLSTR